MSAFPDPVFEAVATLRRQQNKFTAEANASGKGFDAATVAVVALVSCEVMIRLKEIMPEAEFTALHERLHREVPLKFLRMRP